LAAYDAELPYASSDEFRAEVLLHGLAEQDACAEHFVHTFKSRSKVYGITYERVIDVPHTTDVASNDFAIMQSGREIALKGLTQFFCSSFISCGKSAQHKNKLLPPDKCHRQLCQRSSSPREPDITKMNTQATCEPPMPLPFPLTDLPLSKSIYAPNLPQEGTEIDAVQMRGQFNGLKDLIDALVSLTGATVDGVSTINPNEPASATANLVGSVLYFSFSIPQGYQGQQGIQDYQGKPGAQGPPFAQALIDSVNTLDPGQPATVTVTVTVSFDGTFVHFTFGIPRGNEGGQGIQGEQGDQGQPGEVTNSALANAISGTSNNTNAVSTLDTPFADPDAEALRQAYNTLVLAARR